MKAAARTPPPPKLNQPHNSLSLLMQDLHMYCLDRHHWLEHINQLLQKDRPHLQELRCNEPSEWLEQLFTKKKGLTELAELIEYYRYYQNTPTIAHPHYINLMNSYHARTKTLYYRHVKRELQLSSHTSSETIQKNISHEEGEKKQSASNTFYVLPAVDQSRDKPSSNDNNTTIQRILKTMHSKIGSSKIGCSHRAAKPTDKADPFKKQKQKSQQKQERSHKKMQSKTSQNHIITTSSSKKHLKASHIQPHKNNNHKSLFGDQPPRTHHYQGKKVLTANSCQSISRQDIVQFHQRREKTVQKDSSKKKRPSQVHSQQQKGQRGQSIQKQTEHKDASRSSKSAHKPKSNPKQRPPQSKVYVKAMINKVKNKIKAEKCIMLKHYGQSRQSYIKSIDSTCGDTAKAHRR